jgi:hypothetical protein
VENRERDNLADVMAFGIPTATAIQQMILIIMQADTGNNRTLSFSVLIVFLHMVSITLLF